MKTVLIGILVLACSTGLLAQSDATGEIEQGDGLAAKKQWAQAAEHYRKAVDADPQSVKAKALLGATLVRADKQRDGFEILKKLAGLRAGGMDGFETIKALGHELLDDEQMVREAQEALYYAYNIKEDDDHVACELGIAESRMNRSQDALFIWKKSIARNPDQPDVKKLIQDEEKKIAELHAPPKSPSQAAADAVPFNSIEMQPTAGWVLLPDGSTLVIAMSDSAELLYLDTVAEKELKRVTLEFKPGAIVLHRNMLYVSAQGASFVYAIDPASGEQKKEIKVTGDPIIELGAAPDKGYLYATNAHEEVICIDVKDGSASKTAGRGHHIAVDPAGAFVYTARTNPNQWDVVVEKGKDGSESYYWDDWGYRAILTKYAADFPPIPQPDVFAADPYREDLGYRSQVEQALGLLETDETRDSGRLALHDLLGSYPKSPYLRYEWGCQQALAGRWNKAAREWALAADADGGRSGVSVRALEGIAALEAHLGHRDRALDALANLSRVMPLSYAVWNRLAEAADEPTFLQCNMAVNLGNSGGPLFDRWGRTLGIVVAKVPLEGVTFAVDTEQIAEALSDPGSLPAPPLPK